jgi:hypothetical protein
MGPSAIGRGLKNKQQLAEESLPTLNILSVISLLELH